MNWHVIIPYLTGAMAGAVVLWCLMESKTSKMSNALGIATRSKENEQRKLAKAMERIDVLIHQCGLSDEALEEAETQLQAEIYNRERAVAGWQSKVAELESKLVMSKTKPWRKRKS